jgi:hypothetical protein
LALMPFVRDLEARVPLLGRGRAVRSTEALRIRDLLPGLFIPIVRQIEVPRRIAVQFAYTDQAVPVTRYGLEELGLRVPELRLHEHHDPCGLRGESPGNLLPARGQGNLRNGRRIAVHVRVDRRPLAAAANGELHAIAVIHLPKEPVGLPAALLRLLLVVDQVRQQIRTPGMTS